MDSERLIMPAWVRLHGLLGQVDVNDDDALTMGGRENRAIDKAAGGVLFVIRCFMELAEETGRMDDVPEHIRSAWGIPSVDETETLSAWGRRWGSLVFEEGVKVIKQLADGADTAEAILDKLDDFCRASVHRMIEIFVENREKMKQEVKAKCKRNA